MINIMLIDHDKKSRLEFTELIKGIHPHSFVQHSCGTVAYARQILLSVKIDIVFMDISMEDADANLFSGLKYKKPLLIAIAHSKALAAHAWEIGASGYILKPFSQKPMLRSIYKIMNRDSVAPKELLSQNTSLFVKENLRLTRINVKDIYLVEGNSSSVHIHTLAKKYTIHSTMKRMLQKLPSQNFVRVHNSFIVQLNRVSIIGPGKLKVEKRIVPVSIRYREGLKEKLRLL
jgi:two-component system response regulator LytT